MKDNRIEQVIHRKGPVKEEKIKSVRQSIIIFSLISLILTLMFEICVMVDIDLIEYILKINTEKNYIFDNGNLSINVDGMLYQHINGQTKINIEFVTKSFIYLASGIALYVSIFYKLTETFDENITNLKVGLGEINDGNYTNVIEVDGKDELAYIAKNMNRISKKFSKILEEERQTEKSKNELITSIAHDLRTPITSIIGYLELIESKNLDDITKDKYTKIAYDKSKKLERLIEDLFTYTKFSLGQYPVNLVRFNIATLLEQLMDEFYPQFMDADLNYNFNCKNMNIELDADGELIARLFSNLLSNSIKYGKDGKSINVDLSDDDEFVIVKVTNYGKIIPKDEIGKIFDKFYRVESSRSRQTGGTGLGLAIVSQIVEIHKGEITVKSDMDGTVFTVKIPKNLKEDEDENKA